MPQKRPVTKCLRPFHFVCKPPVGGFSPQACQEGVGLVGLFVFDGMVYLYVISLFFYYMAFIRKEEGFRRLGLAVLGLVWVLQTLFFVAHELFQERWTLLTLFESLLFYSWLLVGLTLVIQRWIRSDLFILCSILIGMTAFVLALVAGRNTNDLPMPEGLVSELLVIHVTLAILSYVAFTFAFLFAMMYLFQEKHLKRKRWHLRLRLPSLEQTESLMYWCNMAGVPLLAVSLLLGLVWAHLRLTFNFWRDPKIVSSFIVLALYGHFLLAWLRGMRGERLAWLNVLAFLMVCINVVVSMVWSSFHRW